ncbi:MAG: hypothetical protein FJ125_08335, partial [Deltaproteobacteria bacterium]|nr:hypothetical protein [Deltaproteobacteria bacterium]
MSEQRSRPVPVEELADQAACPAGEPGEGEQQPSGEPTRDRQRDARFVDELTLTVESGAGGNGLVAWRREKYVRHGGPAGGDGGRGGSVVFVADEGLSTLLDLKHRRILRAPRGKDGGRANRTGANGADLPVRVPAGTVVQERDSGRVLADLTEH